MRSICELADYFSTSKNFMQKGAIAHILEITPFCPFVTYHTVSALI